MIALNLDLGNTDITSEVNAILESASRFMYERFKRALRLIPSDPQLNESYQSWLETGITAEQVWKDFAVATYDGLSRLFVVSKRKAVCEKFGAAAPFLEVALRLAKEGSKSAQFKPHLAWTATGFGFWAHVTPDFSLKLSLQAKDALNSVGIPCELSGLPHLIMRPVESRPLATHLDRIPPNELISKLETHIASEDPSTAAWSAIHGMQSLIHMTGGLGDTDGATFTYEPLTPHGLLIIMNFLRDYQGRNIFTKDKDSFFAQREGPYFFNLDAVLDAINSKLIQSNLKPVRKVPIVPHNGMNPFLASWPVGWPHGAFSGKQPRFSFTLPTNANSRNNLDRLKMRVLDIAAISHNLGDNIEISHKRLRDDTKPLNDGITHRYPQMVVQLFSKEDNGTFASNGPTLKMAKAYADAMC